VQTLINTHWHPEQTGSNEAVGKAGGTIIAHEVSRLALGRSERSALYEGYYGPLPPKAIPSLSTYNTGTLMFAGEQVDYRYLPAAHTNGDLFVHFPKRNVIVAGGPVAADHWPVMDYLNGAFMHGFVRSYEILAEVAKADTIIIPANGPTLTGADIVKQKDMYWAVFKQFFIDFNKGFGPNDIVAAHLLKDYEAQYGDASQFLDYAYRSVQLATIPH
jgi:cyclase